MESYNYLKRKIYFIAQLFEYVGWFIILGWVGLMFVGAILRYFFRTPLIFQTDVISIALVVFCSLCFPAVFIAGDHIRVELFTRFLPSKIQNLFMLFSEMIFFVFCISIIFSFTGIISYTISIGSRLDVSNLPVLPFLLCVPIGFALLALLILMNFGERLYRMFDSKKSRYSDAKG